VRVRARALNQINPTPNMSTFYHYGAAKMGMEWQQWVVLNKFHVSFAKESKGKRVLCQN